MSERLQQWKQALQPREIQLSTGPMLIRPVKLQNLVTSKRIPLTLLQKMEVMQRKAGGKTRMEDVIEMVDFFDAVALAACVDPPVTVDGDEDSISLRDDLTLDDKVLIFEEANRPAAAMAPFPERPGEPSVDPLVAPDGEGVRQATE